MFGTHTRRWGTWGCLILLVSFLGSMSFGTIYEAIPIGDGSFFRLSKHLFRLFFFLCVYFSSSFSRQFCGLWRRIRRFRTASSTDQIDLPIEEEAGDWDGSCIRLSIRISLRAPTWLVASHILTDYFLVKIFIVNNKDIERIWELAFFCRMITSSSLIYWLSFVTLPSLSSASSLVRWRENTQTANYVFDRCRRLWENISAPLNYCQLMAGKLEPGRRLYLIWAGEFVTLVVGQFGQGGNRHFSRARAISSSQARHDQNTKMMAPSLLYKWYKEHPLCHVLLPT